MKRFLLVFLLALVILLAACRTEDATWREIKTRSIIRVGIDPTYPPFAVANGDGTYTGLDIDLTQALAAEFGVAAEFVSFGYDGLYDALATNQVDVLISALVIMPERTRDFAYSEPYFNAGELLVVPAGEDEIAEMADMVGRSLAVELGSLGHVEAISWEKRLSALTVLPFPSADEALEAVAARGADAALVDAVSGRVFVAGNAAVQRVAAPVTVEPYAVVVRAADRTLLQEVDAALERLEEDGRLAELVSRALGE